MVMVESTGEVKLLTILIR